MHYSAAQSNGRYAEANGRGFGSSQKLCLGFALLPQENTTEISDEIKLSVPTRQFHTPKQLFFPSSPVLFLSV